jgi:hypothetical protein
MKSYNMYATTPLKCKFASISLLYRGGEKWQVVSSAHFV